jgi:hypothetical protein
MGQYIKVIFYNESRGQILMKVIEMLHRKLPVCVNIPHKPARIIRLFPMLCVQAYLTFTVVLFAIGPWPWPVCNPFTLYTYLILAQLAMWFGYTLYHSHKCTIYAGRLNWERLFNVSLVLNILWIIPNFMCRTGVSFFDVSGIVSHIRLGLSDPGAAYTTQIALVRGMDYSLRIITYATILISPLLYLLLPIGITYWTLLSPWKRALLIFWAVADVFGWVASGTNTGLANFLFLVPIFLIVRKPDIIAKFKLVRVLIILCITILGFYAFLAFFSLGMQTRSGSPSLTGSDSSIGIRYNDSNFVLSAVPKSMRGGVASFCSYLTQGYYGLSLCLNEPFTWSYGLGHSYYLTSWYKKIDPNADIYLLSYPGRVSVFNNWDYFGRWHSIYSWIASDVTFPGTIVVMFLLARLFAKVWLDILWCRNPIATALLAILVTIFVYVPANNPVFGGAPSSAAFWILLVWWLKTRRTLPHRVIPGRVGRPVRTRAVNLA